MRQAGTLQVRICRLFAALGLAVIHASLVSTLVSQVASRPTDSIAGRVVDSDGQGVPLCRIDVVWPRQPLGAAFMSNGLYMYPRRQAKHDVVGGDANAAGLFCLALPWYVASFRPYCMLVVSRQGYGAAATKVFDGERHSPMKCVLRKEDRLRGALYDERGQPLSGARVTLIDNAIDIGHVFSREDGTFDLGGVSLTDTSVLYACRSNNDLGNYVEMRAGQDRQNIKLMVPRGGTRTVHIADAGGRRLSGTRVNLNQLEKNAARPNVRWIDIMTDDDGCVAVTGVMSGGLRLLCGDHEVELPDGPECWVSLPNVVLLPLRAVDECGAAIEEIVLYLRDTPARCFRLCGDSWTSGSRVALFVGTWEVCCAAAGHITWCGQLRIDNTTQGVDIELRRRAR